MRLEVAQRLPPDLLSRLRDDPDWRVRYEVASRIAASPSVGDLDDDSDSFVRDMARSRLPDGDEHDEGRFRDEQHRPRQRRRRDLRSRPISASARR